MELAEKMAEADISASLEAILRETTFQKKYFTLRRKCEQVQQTNEKLVTRLHQVKKLVKKYKKERRLLMGKLDSHGDNYREAQVPAMWEEGDTKPADLPESSKPGKDQEDSLQTASSSTALPAPLPQAGVAAFGHPFAPLLGGTDPLAFGAAATCSKVQKVKAEGEVEGSGGRPANAFFIFCQHQRTRIQEEYFKEHRQDIPNYELTRRLAHLWNSISAEEKQVFFDMCESERAAADLENQAYSSMETAESTPDISMFGSNIKREKMDM